MSKLLCIILAIASFLEARTQDLKIVFLKDSLHCTYKGTSMVFDKICDNEQHLYLCGSDSTTEKRPILHDTLYIENKAYVVVLLQREMPRLKHLAPDVATRQKAEKAEIPKSLGLYYDHFRAVCMACNVAPLSIPNTMYDIVWLAPLGGEKRLRAARVRPKQYKKVMKK